MPLTHFFAGLRLHVVPTLTLVLYALSWFSSSRVFLSGRLKKSY